MDEPTRPGEEVGIAAPGFRMPAGTSLGPVRLQVSDLERSVRFYTEVLGLQTRDSDHGTAGLADLGGTLLVELVERRGAAPVPRRGRLGLYHFALLLPDRGALGAFLSHLAALGIQPGMSDHAVSEAIYLNDPDGLGIEVYADRPRSAWRYHGREIHMTTEPLDVRGLLSAASSEWRGAPAGSAMGHVHLFVADLGQAADFYHRALGLDRVVWSYPGALFLSAGGYHHHLGTNTWAAGAAAAGPDDARLLEWRIVLPEAGVVRDAGESVERAGYEVSWSREGWSADDPWGTTVRVLAAEPTGEGSA